MGLEIEAGGVILNGSKIVLVYQIKTKTWVFPKGHIEKGESELQTAKREIYEESGVKELEFVKELGTYKRPSKESKTITRKITLFLFRTKQEKLEPHDEENPEAKWVDFEGVESNLTYEEDRKFFSNTKELIKNNILSQNNS